MKRLFDCLAAGFGLLLVSPVLLAVAVAIRMDSPGPVLFRQKRVGKDERIFEILKFRSMVVDAPRLGSHSTAANDPRITRVGRFIRRTSLDELPQLLNVLKGDMSLVGPRPDVPAQEGDYSRPDWLSRLSVRPGITGLAQATLRSEATPEERLALDLEYVQKQSMVLDAYILYKTVRQIIGKGGN